MRHLHLQCRQGQQQVQFLDQLQQINPTWISWDQTVPGELYKDSALMLFYDSLQKQGLPMDRFQNTETITDKKFVDEAHDSGLKVHVWTIDDPAEMHQLFDLGVDGIMTDRPQVLKDVMIERGIW